MIFDGSTGREVRGLALRDGRSVLELDAVAGKAAPDGRALHRDPDSPPSVTGGMVRDRRARIQQQLAHDYARDAINCGVVDLRQLRYFVAVAEELHFSRASARLSLAQSALSAQIRQLEGEVGGPLLVRSTRRVELTPAGEALLDRRARILADADERARPLPRPGPRRGRLAGHRLARPGAGRRLRAAALALREPAPGRPRRGPGARLHRADRRRPRAPCGRRVPLPAARRARPRGHAPAVGAAHRGAAAADTGSPGASSSPPPTSTARSSSSSRRPSPTTGATSGCSSTSSATGRRSARTWAPTSRSGCT